MELPAWFSEAGICAALALIAFFCLRASGSWQRRAGIWIIFLTLGTALWFLSGSLWVVATGLIAWFAVPVGQAVYVSRSVTFSTSRALQKGKITSEDLPDLAELTRLLAELGFDVDEDYWLSPSPIEQGYRLLAHRSKPVYAAIAVIKPGSMTLGYLMFVTPAADGTVWITWDYPLAPGLKMPPNYNVYRCLEAESLDELFDSHLEFLQLNNIPAEEISSMSTHDAGPLFDRMFRETIDYNLSIGLLGRRNSKGKTAIGYSWRGTLFISRQVLQELVVG
jgi:hypothetical protein